MEQGRDLQALPKAHLHLHLEGSMRPSTLADLAERYGEPAPAFRPGDPFKDFEACYRAASRLIRTPDDLRRLVIEIAEDAAGSGAVWIEPAVFATDERAALCDLTSAEAMLEVLIDAAAQAERATGTGVGLMLSANRGRPVEEAEAMATLAARHAGKGVVGFGLMGDESIGPPQPFAGAFAIARAAGLLSTPHAGELDGPASVDNAIRVLGAIRIQHGVRAVEDPALVETLARSEVCLDVCPTSNVQLAVVASLAEHPLPALVGSGVRISLNADDPLFFGSGLLEEYELCREAFGMDDDSLATVAAASIRSSGASAELKRSALSKIDSWLADQ
jgi:adenosine deaminase